MSECAKENLIVDYYFRELNRRDRHLFEEHLKKCEHCRELLSDFRAMAKEVRRVKRSAPEKKVIKNYKKILQNSFYPRFNFLNELAEWLETFLVAPSPAMRLVQATIMLVLGIFIGKQFLFHQQTTYTPFVNNDVAIKNNISDQFFQNYLQETKMIFLDVVNADDMQIGHSVRQLAKYRMLLQKTVLCREHAEELNDPVLIDLIDEIELILLDLCNAEDENLYEILETARQQIQDSHLLLEINSIEAQQI